MMKDYFLYIIIMMIYVIHISSFTSCTDPTQVKNYSFKGQRVKLGDIDEIQRDDDNLLHVIDLTKVLDRSRSESTLNFMTLVNDCKLVSLETTNACLIGEIKKIIAVDSLLLILDPFVANKLFVFDRDGNFIRQIGSKGQGPGEYVQATDCYYNQSTQRITIYDQFKSEFLYYDLSGNYLGNKRFTFRFIQFTEIGGKYVYKNLLNNSGMIAKYSLSTGTDSTQIDEVSLPILKFAYAGGILNRINDSLVSYGIPFCDTIYHYNGQSLYPAYHLKFNEKTRLPKNFGENVKYSYEKFRKSYPTKSYSYFNGDFVETSSHLFFYVGYNSFRHQFFYDKIHKQLFGGIASLSRDYPFEEIFLMGGAPPISNENEYFISVIDAAYLYPFLSATEEGDYKQSIYEKYPQLIDLQEESNPLLFFFSIKSDLGDK